MDCRSSQGKPRGRTPNAWVCVCARVHRYAVCATQHVAENARLLSTHCVLACSLDSNTARTQTAAVIFHFAQHSEPEDSGHQRTLTYSRLVSLLWVPEATITTACNNSDFYPASEGAESVNVRRSGEVRRLHRWQLRSHEVIVGIMQTICYHCLYLNLSPPHLRDI